jgi:hypothetical protein
MRSEGLSLLVLGICDSPARQGGIVHGSATQPRMDENPIPPHGHGEVKWGLFESSIFRAGHYSAAMAAIQNPQSRATRTEQGPSLRRSAASPPAKGRNSEKPPRPLLCGRAGQGEGSGGFFRMRRLFDLYNIEPRRRNGGAYGACPEERQRRMDR